MIEVVTNGTIVINMLTTTGSENLFGVDFSKANLLYFF